MEFSSFLRYLNVWQRKPFKTNNQEYQHTDGALNEHENSEELKQLIIKKIQSLNIT